MTTACLFRFRPLYVIGLAAALLAGCDRRPTALFDQLTPDQTGITFQNTIKTDETLNPLTYPYVYNGAGVGVGDFNQDGKPDLFFAGNLVSCRLYLNKTDSASLHFDDVTETAGLTTDRWCTGVSVVDINQDGLPDLYVCVGNNPRSPDQPKTNLLFVNQGVRQGVPRFREMAVQYGLAEASYCSQAAFFDYDRDGDLDCYLLRNFPERFPPNTLRPIVTDGSHPDTDKLLQNDGQGHFTDVSGQAGITQEGYGLGVVVSDVNRDGWPDLYVSNDFISNDILWLNQGNGTFRNGIQPAIRHQSYNGMGVDAADINNDTWPDLMQVDMLPEDNYRQKKMLGPMNYDFSTIGQEKYGYQLQYVRNMLQLNNRLPGASVNFSEIGQLAGVDKTDWSWAPLLADLDNDGHKDLYITNGYRKDITDRDFLMYSQPTVQFAPANSKQQRDSVLDALPEVKLANYAYRNNGDLTFTNVSEQWGLNQPSYANGSVYADLDDDGDLDLVTNNIDEPAFVYRNRTNKQTANKYLRVRLVGNVPNRMGIGATVIIWQQGKPQQVEINPVRGYLSSVEPVAHFGVGSKKVDSVQVIWARGSRQTINHIAVNQTITLFEKEATPTQSRSNPAPIARLFREVAAPEAIPFAHREGPFVDFKRQMALPYQLSRDGFPMTTGDVNRDGLTDIFVGGSYQGSTSCLFVQQPNGHFRKQTVTTDTLHEDTGALLFDADRDGDDDLYVVSGSCEKAPAFTDYYQDRLYENDGTGHFQLVQTALPPTDGSGSCVIKADIDHDGDDDLFIGGRQQPGRYPLPGRSYLLRNDSRPGHPKFTDITPATLRQVGMVCSAVWSDYDRDGWADLLLVGEWMPPTFFRNNKGVLQPQQSVLPTGLWNSVAAGDFDRDGDPDYMVGNLGLNTRYKASAEKPLRIVAKDFNQDGLFDPIIGFYLGDKQYPVASRDVLIGQITAFRGQYPSYDAYANAEFATLFTDDMLRDAYQATVSELRSMYLRNNGNGSFTAMALPTLAQTAPVRSLLVCDVNQDTYLDVIMGGNYFPFEPDMGRCDAFNGLILIGNGKGKFRPVEAAESGLRLTGEVRSMVLVSQPDNRNRLWAGLNSGPIRVFDSGIIPQKTQSVLAIFRGQFERK